MVDTCLEIWNNCRCLSWRDSTCFTAFNFGVELITFYFVWQKVFLCTSHCPHVQSGISLSDVRILALANRWICIASIIWYTSADCQLRLWLWHLCLKELNEWNNFGITLLNKFLRQPLLDSEMILHARFSLKNNVAMDHGTYCFNFYCFNMDHLRSVSETSKILKFGLTCRCSEKFANIWKTNVYLV